ncbi:MAG: bifunctional diaminohydroxyphosphoribosylaminopyrimidine deaminase/5-amino-6-(5-phosphoribosylamino)uracil reductase RibD [Algibacter sp.]|uniref:bifunctional diaminohydroxyphosphoribosylaminopyrimidine deaminase/5-amino-6-(5-phosphoribosylamino)uracil reductase RibD n=1 Tax=Algibacter sp. TaxID=1872428 RepID=UPI002601C26A|nr:bifunctional diaminohydroxyphosphoribosylaminopyrimidine deaminase/5-amino-6-(5-phosphoribosylamino)uracil reductase RibD [Algibacter sp.]MDG1729070.1 bifunctional diaminohydroxyphosphoribosylaminopyrimidine deaminase/5-amino-6-(5-phosphoribosylamino)uracil reductase RibD [Algibacter sp.]MDG2179646.1 bifunctional diaminohydroxyphosphoribosylaminopyrimidine deaminase/5-amino-6-(5-phosphoribosylamino)uracil reductase RibD [Algibacter sp.]
MNIHETYIKRCLEIAKNGLGNTRPNPMVGSVIIHNNTIIGEGFTHPYGGNHAEVNAINSVSNKNLLKEATLYVTLEPCSHFGKTPPCSDLIIKHNIPNVVIGCIDDHEKVAGKGIEKLKNAGCHVTVGVLENECKNHHKRFFTFHNKKRPYIILKWAETNDGFIAPEYKNEQKPVWITNSFSRQFVHKWRTEEQAILVGTNTVLEDNPSLTTRDWAGNNPIRIVIDKNEKLSKKYPVFNAEAESILISKNNIDFSKHIAKQICNLLFQKSINSVIIEGGAKTLQTFIDENLWDEARVFKGQVKFEKGVKAPKLKGRLMSEINIITDTLKIYKND